MARRGTTKRRSRDQEDRFAKAYGGRVSPSSGASVVDDGDVRTDDMLMECKVTGSVEKPAKSISIKLDDLEKIVDEAYGAGKEPAMGLTIVNHESILADHHGNIDLTVRLTKHDVARST